MTGAAFDLSSTNVHLGLGSSAVALDEFSWSPEYLRGYFRRFAADRGEGRLVGTIWMAETWTRWECHLGGDELVVQLSGHSDVIQEVDGEHRTISLRAGQALINPKGTWHTADVHEPGSSLFVAAGGRTTYRPRNSPEPPK